MDITGVLGCLNEAGIRLSARDGQLQVSAPKGAMTAELKALLGQHKAALLQLLEHGAQQRAAAGLVPVPREGRLPLSLAQQRLWFLEQLEGASTVYNKLVPLRLEGELDVAALRQAVAGIVQRHEALRCRFLAAGGEPFVEVVDALELPIAVREIRAEALDAEIVREAARPFALDCAPLLRVSLLRLAPRTHVLLLSIHHVVSDGWSMGVLVQEFGALYAACRSGQPSPLAPLPVQYIDYAAWQRQWLQGEELQRQLGFWRTQLAELPPLLELPTDRPRPALQGHAGQTLHFALPAGLGESLQALARRENVSLFMLLLAVFKVLLARYTGQGDIVVGTPVANREHAELEGLIGFFANTLVLRDRVEPAQPFNAFLADLKERTLAAYRHQSVSFEQLVEELQPARSMSYSPLIQVLFALQNAPLGEIALPGLQASLLGQASGTAKYDLTLELEESASGLRGSLEYKTELFEAATIARLRDHFVALLAAVVATPARPLGQLPLLGAAEREQLLVEWNDTAATFGAAGWVHTQVEAQAAHSPTATALVFEGVSMDYATLNARANRLAHYLRAQGVGPDVIVGVSQERSFELVISLLAVMKAGGAYLPVDPEYPAERIGYLLQDAQPRLLLTTVALQPRLPATTLPQVCVDRDAAQWHALSAANPAVALQPDHLIYVFYTSGSTGKPKGTMNTHGAVRNRLCWMQQAYRLESSERVLQKTPYSFDVSAWEFFWPLMVGATLVVARPDGHRDPAYLRQLIASEGISTAHFVPSMLQVFLNEPGVAELTGLRRILCSGEALPTTSAERLLERLPQVELHNLYGPTEAAIDVSAWRCAAADLRHGVPIGHPIANLRLYVLDAEMQPVPVGVAGELYIGGIGLARGYLGRPDLTAEKFVPDPFDPAGARLYCTGDSVRLRADGAIEYLQRLDHQVKVRGFRIELGEIEAVLADQPGIREAAVLALADDHGDKRLVAYVAGPAEADVPTLRAALQAFLPEHMVPAHFVRLDAMPVTANGKLDRKALPAADLALQSRAPYAAPGTATETELVAIWAAVLHRDTSIGIHDNFFEIGGHSLLATQVAARIRDVANVAIQVRQLFDTPTVAALAAWVDVQEPADAFVPKVALLRPQRIPLSFAQQRLWIIDQLEGASATYNIAVALRLSGALDVSALQASLQDIVDRHEVLRTSFAMAQGEPMQVIEGHVALDVPLREVGEGQVTEAFRAFAAVPFELARGPLLRASLLRQSAVGHVLMVNMHHIISDGWSIGVLVDEFVASYRSRVTGAVASLPPLPIQYADFAQQQRLALQGDSLRKQQAYWQAQLADLPPLLPLPTDRPRPAVQGFAGASHAFMLPRSLGTALKHLSQAQGATLFMTLLAAFKVLLARYSGQADIAVGTPIANRTRPELERLIGFFVNTLVLRTEVRPEQTFAQLLAEVRRTALAAYEHQDLPFEQLVEMLQPARSMSHSPLVQVMFSMQNTPGRRATLPGLEMTALPSELSIAKFDLQLDMEETDEGVRAILVYRTDLFEADSIARLGDHFTTLLGNIVKDPAARLDQLRSLTDDEQATMRELNGTPAVFAVEQCLHTLFEARAAATPDATAVRFDGASLSYGELNARANQLAHYLRAQGVGPNALVGLCLERSALLVVGLLAVLKAGGAYLPIDPECPRERFQYILDDAKPSLLVTEEDLRERIPPGAFEVVAVDQNDGPWSRLPAGDPGLLGGPHDLAYVIYTSGSTGRPKGVLVEHRHAVRLFEATHPWFEFDQNDIWALFHSCAFDFSVWELWGPLLHGGCVVVVPYWVSRSPEDLHALLCRERVTFLNHTPTAFRSLMRADAASAERLHLRWLAIGGETLDLQMLRPWFDRYSDQSPRVANVYGITETTVLVTYQPITRADLQNERGSVIGRPMADLQVYVVDSHGQLAPFGVPGEILVGGAGVTRGYLNQPELTARKFLVDGAGLIGQATPTRLYRTGDLARYLANGDLEYLGRIDAQVKIRGFRIELGEIENALTDLPDVQAAVVLTVADEGGDKRLVAYVAGQDGLDGEWLRGALRERLPGYMVPSYFVMLDALPLTANGKLDTRALPAVDLAGQSGAPYVAPTSETELRLAKIWGKVLKRDTPIGIHDNFFEIGGHSLLASQVVNRAGQVFDAELPLRQLFETPTVAGLAGWLRERQSAQSGPLLVPVPRGRPVPLSFAQQRVWFLHQLEGPSATYNIPVAIDLRGTLDAPALQLALQDILHRHEALRTSFAEHDGMTVQRVHPPMPLPMPLLEVSASALPQHIERDAAEPFDLDAAPLFRARLLRLDETHHVLLVCMHHIVSDGWSFGVLVDELERGYRARLQGVPADLPPLAVQYGDFAHWQRERLQGAALQAEVEHWREALGGLPTLLPLPTDRVRPAVQSYRGAGLHECLPRDLCDRLQTLSRQQGVTLYMTLLATFNVLLARYAGVDDIAVGTSIANRNRPELEALIGFFVNTLIVRTRVDESQTFVELLQQVRDSVLDVYAHQDLPFEQLVEALQPVRSRSHSPWFQVMLVLQNTPMGTLELPGLDLSVREPHGTIAKYDLSLYLTETPEGLRADLEYSTDLFDEATMVTLLGHYRTLLEGVVAAPGQRIDRLSMIAPPEREQLLGWATPVPVADASLAHPCLHRLFEARAREQPDAVAVREGSRTISYAALDTAANQLAHRLLAGGLAPETPVGLLMERSIAMATGFLGILKAGAVYVPINPELPDSRIETILADAALTCVATTRAFAARVDGWGLDAVVLDDPPSLGTFPASAPEVPVGPGHLAYAIFTSGSTGKPKGVLVEHRAIASSFNAWNTLYRLSRDTRKHLQMAGIGFDVCIGDMTRALCSGGELVICPKDTLLEPAELARILRDHGIHFAEFVPAVLRQLVAYLQRGGETLPAMKFVVAGSDVWHAEDLRSTHRVVAAQTAVVNSYGLTEAAVDSTCFVSRPAAIADVDADGAAPIGQPLAGVSAYVLDPAMGLSPRGVPGELYIGGPTLARGYLHAPQTTAARFVPDPFGAPGSRLYRTGDLARWRGDGSLELLGRADYQVKIRGFRIELGEVEQVLRSLSGIHDTVVLALPRPGGLSLAAYVVAEPAAGYDARVLRERLQAHLPDYMVPAAFVLLDALPQSSNGKIDRKALPAPDFSDQQRAGQVAPRSDDEARLCAIWSEVLGVDTIGIHDNFFEIGGHSLLATQVVSRMRQAFDVAMPVRQLFDSPTVAELALWVDAQGRQSAGPALVAVPRTAPLPLSFAQQRLWFIDQLEGAHAAYNMPAALRLSGTLDVAALRASIQAIVDRHETLRTCFATVAGEPVQQIAAQRTIEVPLVEVEEAALMSRAQAFAEAPFDLARGPLLRAELLRLGPGEHVLLTNMHHIISDGWSVGVLVGEFVALYRARVEGAVAALPALPVQYADFAQWQRQCLQGETLQRQQDYWKTQLAELPPLLTLPTDRPRPAVQGMAGGSHAFVLPAALTQALKALGQARGATLFMTLLAAFKVLLARYAGQADIAVGTPIANRTRPELEGLIGFFVNTLVLRTQVRPEQSFETLLDEVRTTALAAYEHQDLPFEQLVEYLNPERSLSHSPLFQVMFVLQNNARHEHALPGLAVSLVEPEERLAQFDLTLELEETGDASLSGRLSYRTELFEPATIARLAEYYTTLLGGIAANGDTRVGRLPMASPTDPSVSLTPGRKEAEASVASGCLHQRFEVHARTTPDAVALHHEGIDCSYAELNRRANRLAHYLRGAGVGPDVLVGVCLERSIELVVALLAVLKAGGAYVPLDPGDPAERTRHVLEDASVSLVLTRSRVGEHVAGEDASVVLLDRDQSAWDSLPSTDPEADVRPGHLAYVIYTSGSTGRPKGVLVEHACATALLQGFVDVAAPGPAGANTLVSPFGFDVSVWELFDALSSGSAAHILSRDWLLDPQQLAGYWLERRISTAYVPPAVLEPLVSALEASGRRPALRRLLVGVEPIDAAVLRRYLALCPELVIVNGYGPTEATVCATLYRFDTQSSRPGQVPIGRAVPGYAAYLLDGEMQPVPLGAVGELYIGGAGVARGYLGDPMRSAARFVPDPFSTQSGARCYRTGDLARQLSDGNLAFVGRRDAQVKVRGFRIELHEIDLALAASAEVADCVTLASEHGPGGKRLVAYVVPGGGAAPTPASLRAHLRARLPDYMLPSGFVFLHAMPLTGSGKLDRRALPEPTFSDTPGADFVAADSDTEKALVLLWGELLQIARIGIHDNFFDIGGHSLLATQVVTRVRQEWGIELPVRRLFETPTIHELASYIDVTSRLLAGRDGVLDRQDSSREEVEL